LKTSRH